jgi:hypothetical protein
MPSGCRRVSYAALAMVVAALAAFLASPAAAAASTARAATDPVSVVVKVGYSGFVKTQQWMPVTIDVTNTGQDVEGTLEVSPAAYSNGPPVGSAIYVTHLSLPSGASKHLKTYVVEGFGASPVSVRVVENGRVVASADSQTGTAASALIGVLSDQPTALDSFAAVHPGAISANVVHLSLEDVGDSAALLRAFDLLAIDDFATDTLTAAQRSAMTDYVQNGGALVLGTGASWRKTLAGVSSAILPMTIDSTTTLNSVAALGRLSGVEVASGALNAGASAWLSEGGKPLLAERFVGGGLVTLATFDWNQEPIAGWSGADVLLRQVLVRTLFSSATPPTLAMGKFGMTSGSVTGRSMQLIQALGSLPALDLPSLVVIGLLVLAYVLFVGPINYFALRALRHRALAWVTVPLIAIVASAGAFGAGRFTKGQSVQTNQVSIIHLQAGWDRAYEESYSGVLAPTRGDYQVDVAGNHTLVGPISSYDPSLVNTNSDVIRVSADNNSILLPGMTAFVLRGFATEGVVDAPRLIATAKLVNGKLTGSIQNNSTMHFTDLVVLAGDGYQLLPGLAPGATATFSVTPKTSNPYAGPPSSSTIYGNNFNGYGNNFNGPPTNPTTDADREAMVKSSILSLLTFQNFFGITQAISPMVVAWTKQPNEHLSVAGSRPRSTAETAIVLPLRISELGLGSLPAGVVSSRFTDIEGTTLQGPPGGVVMQDGTVTYEFTPRLAPGTHLTGATLDATSQAGNGIATTPQSFQAEVWDWSQSRWVPLAYNPASTTAVPASAIDPSSGEVRLRVTVTSSTNGQPGLASGGVLLGAISLTGTAA